MLINSASIYTASIILLAGLPRLLYFAIGSKKKLPPQLFEGRNLILFLINVLSFFSLVVMTLFLSKDFASLGTTIIWSTLTLLALGVLMIAWVIFFMNGYDPRYQFKKVIVPCPMVILVDIVFWLAILFTFNWWATIPCTVFTVSSYFWNFAGYKLTKPVVDDDIPLREDDGF